MSDAELAALRAEMRARFEERKRKRSEEESAQDQQHPQAKCPRIVQRDPRIEWLLGRGVEPVEELSGECQEENDVTEEEEEENTLTLLTWNIDGLTEFALRDRTLAVVATIEKVKPEIVFLQEVISVTENLIQERLEKTFHIIRPSPVKGQQFPVYYCLTLIKKRDSTSVIKQECLWYPHSQMERHLLRVIYSDSKDRQFCLMNSHLESCREFAEERKLQFKMVLEEILARPKDEVVLFGGDLNARDTEVKSVLKPYTALREKLKDLWEWHGCSIDEKYTWDLKLNDNLGLGKSRCRCRFDRFYYYVDNEDDPPVVEGISKFSLVGRWRLSKHQCYPSDHFGVLVTLKLRS